MPSLQTALPPELANNVIRLYRECLRRAKYIGHRAIHGFGRITMYQQHNTKLVVDMVRQQFKKHMHETDPEKIQKLKDEQLPFPSNTRVPIWVLSFFQGESAARGLINHMLHESEKMSGRKLSKSS